MINRKLRKEEGDMKGIRQEEYNNDVYNLVVEKQKEIFDTTGDMKTVKDVIYIGIELGIKLFTDV